ncbi:MAG: hypothetical protein QXR44_05680 [Thermoproteota archaeon]
MKKFCPWINSKDCIKGAVIAFSKLEEKKLVEDNKIQVLIVQVA